MKKKLSELLFAAAATLVLAVALCATAAAADAVYYLKDGGDGDGSSSALAGGSLADAYAPMMASAPPQNSERSISPTVKSVPFDAV